MRLFAMPWPMMLITISKMAVFILFKTAPFSLIAT
jgi:hypothetical protein